MWGDPTKYEYKYGDTINKEIIFKKEGNLWISKTKNIRINNIENDWIKKERLERIDGKWVSVSSHEAKLKERNNNKLYFDHFHYYKNNRSSKRLEIVFENNIDEFLKIKPVQYVSDLLRQARLKLATGKKLYTYFPLTCGNSLLGNKQLNLDYDSQNRIVRFYSKQLHGEIYYKDCFMDNKENESLEEIVIYPNPSSDWINLKLPEVVPIIEIKIVVDKNRKNILQKQIIDSDKVEINITDLTNGQYLLICRLDKKIVTKKFLKIR